RVGGADARGELLDRGGDPGRRDALAQPLGDLVDEPLRGEAITPRGFDRAGQALADRGEARVVEHVLRPRRERCAPQRSRDREYRPPHRSCSSLHTMGPKGPIHARQAGPVRKACSSAASRTNAPGDGGSRASRVNGPPGAAAVWTPAARPDSMSCVLSPTKTARRGST